MVGCGPHLLPAAHRSVVIPRGLPAAFGRRTARRGEEVVRESGERTTRVPEVSGGYSVITVPSREPTNQTKRDKDKQRFEPTKPGRGKNKAEARRMDGEGRKEKDSESERERWVGGGEVREPGERRIRRGSGEESGDRGRERNGPSLSMTCDRFLLCNSLQLAATRQPLRFPSLPPPPPTPPSPPTRASPFASLPPDFRRSPLHHAQPPCNRARCIGHLLSSIDRLGRFDRRAWERLAEPIKTTPRLTATVGRHGTGPYVGALVHARASHTGTLVTCDTRNPLPFTSLIAYCVIYDTVMNRKSLRRASEFARARASRRFFIRLSFNIYRRI